jgi:hypothetical protein
MTCAENPDIAGGTSRIHTAGVTGCHSQHVPHNPAPAVHNKGTSGKSIPCGENCCGPGTYSSGKTLKPTRSRATLHRHPTHLHTPQVSAVQTLHPQRQQRVKQRQHLSTLHSILLLLNSPTDAHKPFQPLPLSSQGHTNTTHPT